MKTITRKKLSFAGAGSTNDLVRSRFAVSVASAAAVLLIVAGCGGGSGQGDGADDADANADGDTPTDIASCPTVTETLAYDELIDGDLSTDRENPTVRALAAGANSVALMTGGEGDRQDYLTVQLEPCMTLDSVFVQSYEGSGGDEIGALILQRGNTLTVDPTQAFNSIDQLLGFTLFGTANVGLDVLAMAGQGEGAEGFTTPLPADNYTFWLNQTGPQATYELIFNVSLVDTQ